MNESLFEQNKVFGDILIKKRSNKIVLFEKSYSI